MKLVVTLLLFIFVFVFFVKSQTFKKYQPLNLSIKISLLKDTFKAKEAIAIKMVLTNCAKVEQKILFDKPNSSTTGGPAYTFIQLIDLQTKQSVLKYGNKEMLSSRIYLADDLKDKYYFVKAGQSLITKFELLDLGIIDFTKNELKKGNYQLQVFYSSYGSNKLVFNIN